MNEQEIRAAVNEIQWFHNYELVPGIITNGVSPMQERMPYFQIPQDLTGKRVLDIGCADGYFTFLAESRGATVVSIDSWPWHGYSLAHKVRSSQAKFHHMSVYDIHPDNLGMFDIVFFFGVFYHLKHPLLALERVAQVTRKLAIVESEVIPERQVPPGMKGMVAQMAEKAVPPQHPAEVGLARFYERDSLNGDPTNWWIPDMTTLVGSVRAAGFPRVELVTRYHRSRGVVHAYKGPRTVNKSLTEDFFVHIDPVSSVPADAAVKVTGWALSQLDPEGGIERVVVYVDQLDDPEFQLGEAEYGIERPDLTRPFIPAYLNCGYEFIWDTAGTAPGQHTLYVMAEGERGWHYRSTPVTLE
jgi:tRNA (mo5U34)-methyltransferase